MKQKAAFIKSEGDAWFARNKGRAGGADPVLDAMKALHIAPKRILEIGCSDGSRLAKLQKQFNAACFGVDPSQAAIASGTKRDAGLKLSVGTADHLSFADTSFDLIVFGFCLYLTDPSDHFCIAQEADRVLADKSFLIIKDFCTPVPYRRAYAHRKGLSSYKMDWSRMFLWHPSYRLMSRAYLEHGEPYTFERDEAVTVDVLYKDTASAFPQWRATRRAR